MDEIIVVDGTILPDVLFNISFNAYLNMCFVRETDGIINRSLIARLRLIPKHNDLINLCEDLARNCEENNNRCDKTIN